MNREPRKRRRRNVVNTQTHTLYEAQLMFKMSSREHAILNEHYYWRAVVNSW